MVNVTNRADVNVGFRAFKLFLSHGWLLLLFVAVGTMPTLRVGV